MGYTLTVNVNSRRQSLSYTLRVMLYNNDLHICTENANHKCKAVLMQIIAFDVQSVSLNNNSEIVSSSVQLGNAHSR